MTTQICSKNKNDGQTCEEELGGGGDPLNAAVGVLGAGRGRAEGAWHGEGLLLLLLLRHRAVAEGGGGLAGRDGGDGRVRDNRRCLCCRRHAVGAHHVRACEALRQGVGGHQCCSAGRHLARVERDEVWHVGSIAAAAATGQVTGPVTGQGGGEGHGDRLRQWVGGELHG